MFNGILDECALCGRKIVKIFPMKQDIYDYHCGICGDVRITYEAIYNNVKSEIKALLSGITRNRTERMEMPIIITSDNIESLILQAGTPRTIPEKLDVILQYLSEKTNGSLGESIQLNIDIDYTIAYCKNSSEFLYLLNAINDQALANISAGRIATILPKGWDRLYYLKKKKIISDQAFIAMWFSPEMENIYGKGIESAIIKCGYRPLRVDKLEHNGKICDAIIAEIRWSAFLVADFTGHRGGVYFEAGFAMGLGIPVIWLCKESDIGEAHFDTRQYNHILWNDENELAKKLCDRINATIVRKPDNIVSK